MHAFQIGAFQSDAFQIPLEEATATTGGGGGGFAYIEYRTFDKEGKEHSNKVLARIVNEALEPKAEPAPAPIQVPPPQLKPKRKPKPAVIPAPVQPPLEALQSVADAVAALSGFPELVALQARLRREKQEQEAAEALALQIATERLEAIVAAEAFERKKRAAAIALITILAAV